MAKESKQFVQRQFASGSRVTPDIHDQFLDKLGFYRKHTPTDSTCLFRVVSEQEHGVQIYHEKVRRNCVEYMGKHQLLFAKNIKWNFQSYLQNMALTRTYGSILELKALAMYYNANVVIFEPFTKGRWFVQSETATTTWRLFWGPDNHFDSVFTLEYMKEAAYCQALMYEILYKNVFRMPDVDYAVERMLYDPDDTRTTYEQNDQGQTVATTADGRQLVMSVREDTDCVLTDYRLCHFHHGRNFIMVQRFFSVHGNDAGYRLFGGFAGSNFRQGGKKPNPLLCEGNVSCVRQLLNMGITPFAYKAAKSLDVNIYRNVEFDSWMDSIKMGDIPRTNETVFQVGMKCLYHFDGSLRVCRIETIQPDRQTCLVRMNNATSLICVRKEALRPYHPQKLGTRHLERTHIRHTEQSLRIVNPARKPTKEGIQYPASVHEAPPGLDANAQMLMQTTMPLPTQHERVDWQTAVEPMGSPMLQFNPTALLEAEQPNMVEQNIVYGRLAALPPIPMSPAVWQYANTLFAATKQQELYLESHQHQKQQEQHLQQQILNYQQQQQLHLPLQLQLQQSPFPISIVSYKHHGNCPAHNCSYEIVVPVDSTQQPHLNQLAVGYESICGAGPARHIHGVFHYLPNVADHASSSSIETTATMMPYTLDSDNARVYPGNLFFH